VASAAAPTSAALPAAAPEAPSPATKRARKTASRRKAAPAPDEAPAPAALAVAAAPAPVELPPRVQQILQHLPELARGDTVELRVASVRLREAGLLSRSGSCTRLFAPYADRFELLPAGQPNHVRLRNPA
jgi:hypothetical protein